MSMPNWLANIITFFNFLSEWKTPMHNPPPPPLCRHVVIGVITTAALRCDFSNWCKTPLSSESAVHREKSNDFLSVVLSWPADAIQPRSLITHPDACAEPRTHRRCMQDTLQVHTHVAWGVDRSKCFMQDNIDAVSLHFCSFKWLWPRSHPACDTQLGTSVVCRPLQAFWSAHRWLQWAFANAHRVNKATRHAQQMLHKWGFTKLHILHLVWVTKRGRIQGCSYTFENLLINVSLGG